MACAVNLSSSSDDLIGSWIEFECTKSWRNFLQNKEDQENEISILQSMYDKNIVLNSNTGDGDDFNSLQCFIEIIPLEPPILVQFSTENHDAAGNQAANAASGKSEEFRPDFNRSISGRVRSISNYITHLSPITLTVILPKEYPENQKPLFTVSCLWLNSIEMTKICKELDKLWTEYSGFPVLYNWISWLQNEMLKFLDIQDVLFLNFVTNCSSSVDSRVIVETENHVETMFYLIEYDRMSKQRKFNLETQTCPVCFDDTLGVNFILIKPCFHYVCYDCFQHYILTQIDNGNLTKLLCPEGSCEKIILPQLLRIVLSDDEYERYETLMVTKTLESTGEVVYCTRCKSMILRDEQIDEMAHCMNCGFTMCVECGETWHPGNGCTSADERLDQLDKKLNQKRDKNSEIEELRRKLQERRSEEELKKSNKIKACPNCKRKIEKNGGCNKMSCPCGANFCWICNKKIDGYGHFNSSCILFQVETRVMNRPPVGDFHEGYLALQVLMNANENLKLLRCPRCSQKNARSGSNNHIRCWFCKGSFCYACKNLISGPIAMHYNAQSKCNQHSSKNS